MKQLPLFYVHNYCQRLPLAAVKSFDGFVSQLLSYKASMIYNWR